MTNKAKAFAVLNTFADSRIALIKGMKGAGYSTLEECRPIVIEWACGKTGASFNVSAKGKVMLDSTHAKYEATKTVVRDVMHMIEGTTRHAVSARKEKADPLAVLAKKLAKLSAADQRKVLKLAGL
jgi:hypothetical protein